MTNRATTIGQLRELISNAPADLPLFPAWVDGPPGDNDPGVVIHGVELAAEGLKILVDIFYLGEDEDDEAGDDMCDICMRSGVAVYRTTLNGDTVCESDDCQTEADSLDAEYRKDRQEENGHDDD